jgi:hypothetical protein
MAMFGPDHLATIYSSIAKIENRLFEKNKTPQQRREVEALITELKDEVAKLNSAFAQSVGFPICHCKPPAGTPMAWIETQSAYVCRDCGHAQDRAKRAVKVGQTSRDRMLARRGIDNNDWDIFTGK